MPSTNDRRKEGARRAHCIGRREGLASHQTSSSKSALLLTFLIASLGTVAGVEAQSTWSPTGLMTTPRSSHTATLLADGRVLVVGGWSGAAVLATTEIYDPVSGTWSPAGSMSTARSGHRAIPLSDGRVLVIGGWSGSATLASAKCSDPVLSTWSSTAAMSTPRRFHTATLLSDGRVLVVGGFSGSSHLASAKMLESGGGQLVADKPNGLGSRGLPARGHFALDGRVLVSGSGFFSSAEI